MSNPIKYSTGSESLALKKGNFYIGTGDVGKGPTSTTGYYNGISPPSGGYTIYLNKASGGPSIYTASNDAQLISLTNSIAGQSYTTVNQCLTYFAGQSDKICVNRDYEGIVTDGLIFNLDAGFTPSYPKNGTTWYDLAGSNNGTLTNGPTFSSNNGGIIVFDGVDDYIELGTITSSNPLMLNSALTMDVWVYAISSGDLFQRVIDKSDEGGARNGYGMWFHKPDNTLTVATSTAGVSQGNTKITDSSVWDRWVNVTYTLAATNDSELYIDGIKRNDVTRENTILFPPNVQTNMRIGTWNHSTAREFKGSMGGIRLYNRALSEDEVLQNHNAQKGRFGL